MPFGNVLIYTFDRHGATTTKENRQINTVAPPA
jgi:hypothetical protein